MEQTASRFGGRHDPLIASWPGQATQVGRSLAIDEGQHMACTPRFRDIHIAQFFPAPPCHPELALAVKMPWQQDNTAGRTDAGR